MIVDHIIRHRHSAYDGRPGLWCGQRATAAGVLYPGCPRPWAVWQNFFVMIITYFLRSPSLTTKADAVQMLSGPETKSMPLVDILKTLIISTATPVFLPSITQLRTSPSMIDEPIADLCHTDPGNLQHVSYVRGFKGQETTHA